FSHPAIRNCFPRSDRGRRNAGRRIVHPRLRARLPPPNLSRLRGRHGGGLACRRSTTALAAATKRHRSAPVTRFLGRNSVGAGVIRPLPSQCSGLPRRPVIMPAGRFYPEPPGSGGDEPPPAGTAPAPSAGVAG